MREKEKTQDISSLIIAVIYYSYHLLGQASDRWRAVKVMIGADSKEGNTLFVLPDAL